MGSSGERFILLIGVGNYQEATGLSVVPSSLNDIAAWEALFQGLGVAADRIRTLTDAVTDEANAAVDWFATQLHEHAGATGIVVFVGHGDLGYDVGGFGALADWAVSYVGQDERCVARAGYFYFNTLHQLIEDRAPEAALISIVDACRMGTNTNLSAIPDHHLMLLASQPANQAFVRHLGGQDRSLFSWAMQMVLEQWDRDETSVRISYARLLDRTRELMAVFSRPGQYQIPEMHPVDSAFKDYAFLRPPSLGPGAPLDFPTRGEGIEVPIGTTELHPSDTDINLIAWSNSDQDGAKVYWYSTDANEVFGGKYPKTKDQNHYDIVTDTQGEEPVPDPHNPVRYFRSRWCSNDSYGCEDATGPESGGGWFKCFKYGTNQNPAPLMFCLHVERCDINCDPPKTTLTWFFFGEPNIQPKNLFLEEKHLGGEFVKIKDASDVPALPGGKCWYKWVDILEKDTSYQPPQPPSE